MFRHMNNSHLFLALMLSITLVNVSYAEPDVQLAADDFFNEFPIVLTATRLKQSKNNSPIATTIIDREMIDASGFTEIVDILRLAPGMLVNYENGHIGAAGYMFLFDRYRARFQVVIDGMSVYTPLMGEMPWTQLGITVDDIERIEIIRGPSSSSYGPNALTGVISIMTRHAVLDKGIKFKAKQGVNGRSEQFLTSGGTSGNFDYRLSLAARKDHGFKRRYDNKDLALINFRGDYQATNNDTVTIAASHNSGDYQEDASDGLNDAMPEHIRRVKYSTFQTKWTHNFSENNSFTFHYYRQNYTDHNKYVGDYNSAGYGLVPIDEGHKSQRENLEISYSTYSDWYSLNLGALYRKDNSVAAEFLYNVDKDIETRQAFINTVFHLNESNTVNMNLLYDDTITAGETLSPRLALNHHINKKQTVRLSYSESTRSPFVVEEYLNREIFIPLIGDYYQFWSDLSDLKPERIRTYDIGYIGLFNNNATEVELRLHKNVLTDIIVLDPEIDIGGFKQGSAFDVDGVEATISHKFKDTKVLLNYAKIKITAKQQVVGNAADYETGAPGDVASLLVMHDFDNSLKGSLGYYYTDGYQQLCCEVQQQDPRNRLDLVLSKSFKISGHNSKLKLVLQNALNEKINTRFYNNYHRQGYISFSLEL